MYDTVNFRLSSDDVPTIDFLQETPCYLDEGSMGVHDYGGEQTVTGSIGNLKVFINCRQIKVKDGSLCKWYLGDNFKEMGRQDTQLAVEKLSDILHVPMDKATVTRMDVAKNFIMQHPVSVYFGHLGMLQYAKRLQEPNGIYYTLGSEERLCFYDKISEQRANRNQIPEWIKGKNVLRYEQRYLRNLPKRLGVDKVTAALLYDETFYVGLTKRYGDTYKRIEKTNDSVLNIEAMTSTKQFIKACILTAIECKGGEVEFFNRFSEAQKRGGVTNSQACRLRKKIKEAYRVGCGLTVPSKEIEELDKKVIEAVRFCR